MRGWLIVQEIKHPQDGPTLLYLFVTEDLTNAAAAAAYRQRLCVETDIKDLKCRLVLAELRGTSVAMVGKEVTLASVAHNLVNQTRRLAAARAGGAATAEFHGGLEHPQGAGTEAAGGG